MTAEVSPMWVSPLNRAIKKLCVAQTELQPNPCGLRRTAVTLAHTQKIAGAASTPLSNYAEGQKPWPFKRFSDGLMSSYRRSIDSRANITPTPREPCWQNPVSLATAIRLICNRWCRLPDVQWQIETSLSSLPAKSPALTDDSRLSQCHDACSRRASRFRL